jgi:hypothetical protein
VAPAWLVLPLAEVIFFLAHLWYKFKAYIHIPRLTGYSWKTSHYGLTADTVTEFELVLPNREIKLVTETDEDLWFALKVGDLKRGYKCMQKNLHPFNFQGWAQ